MQPQQIYKLHLQLRVGAKRSECNWSYSKKSVLHRCLQVVKVKTEFLTMDDIHEQLTANCTFHVTVDRIEIENHLGTYLAK